MKTSDLLSFEELLTNGIAIDDSQNVFFEKIEIPKIQRAYAQGRLDAVNVRNDILKTIFHSLEHNEEIQFSFIYGSKSLIWNSFELLDGQQRLTTLFLVHWYIFKVESMALPEYLKKFSYQTRDTSKFFIERLCGKDDLVLKDLDGNFLVPSEEMKKFKWFTDEFLCDATVVSMLNMLDAIHDKYVNQPHRDLTSRLGNLKFYALLLENFELSEELYIKMNSRGLKLTSFENFKADIVDFIKENSYYSVAKYAGCAFELGFSAKIDSQWIDLFWQNSAKDKGEENALEPIETDDFLTSVRYLRFFRFFFLAKSFTEDFENAADLREFFNASGKNPFTENELKQEYEGFEHFNSMLVVHPEYLERIAFLLDFLLAYYDSDIKDSLQNPYGIVGAEKKWDFFDRPNMTANQLFIWIALVEFVDAMQVASFEVKDFSSAAICKLFKQYMRVAWNVNENTTFEHVFEVESPARIFAALIHKPNNFTGDFFKNLSNDSSSTNLQYQEEKMKAAHIIKYTSEDWESAFIAAEKHLFFKGSINFFFDDSLSTVADFNARVVQISPLFDQNGIANEYRAPKKHILLRAIFSTCDTWGRLNSLQISEGTVEYKLRNFLQRDVAIQGVLKGFFSQSIFTTFENYLEDVVSHAKPVATESQSFKRVFDRIVVDGKASDIIEWLGTKTFIHLKAERNGNILIGLHKKKNQWLVLDDDRTSIINKLIKEANFSFVSEESKSCNKPGYYTLDPKVHKVIQSKNKEIIITFGFKKRAEVRLRDLNTKIVELVESPSCESLAQDYGTILASIQRIESSLFA